MTGKQYINFLNSVNMYPFLCLFTIIQPVIYSHLKPFLLLLVKQIECCYIGSKIPISSFGFPNRPVMLCHFSPTHSWKWCSYKWQFSSKKSDWSHLIYRTYLGLLVRYIWTVQTLNNCQLRHWLAQLATISTQPAFWPSLVFSWFYCLPCRSLAELWAVHNSWQVFSQGW